MCLILFALKQHPRYPLVIAANRDEFYKRPSRNAHQWSDEPEIFAGRDLEGGGTWLGINKKGEFSAVTNFRSGRSSGNAPKSRGELTRNYLSRPETISSTDYLQQLTRQQDQYQGFNLLSGSKDRIFYLSNRSSDGIKALNEGIFGLSNALLDTPWPKTETGKKALSSALQTHQQARPLAEALFSVMADQTLADDTQLPDTGVGLSMERFLSPRFLAGIDYGTRSSTVLLFDQHGGIDFFERNFSASDSEEYSSTSAAPESRHFRQEPEIDPNES
jgi:uncharacterized protein with NRDE domain